MVSFRHEWHSPLGREETWKLLAQALQSSKNSKIWPTQLAETRLISSKFEQGSIIAVHYRLGPLKANALYEVAKLLPPKYLRYQATDRHPLKGGAEISLTSLPDGTTRFKWEGRYLAKNMLSYPALAFFRLYFERRFFNTIVRNFEALRSTRGKRKSA